MEVDNQYPYWDRVAETKQFTHPLDVALLQRYASPASRLLDYGCGYGRIVQELAQAGFSNVMGVDTSAALIKRGQRLFPLLTAHLCHLATPHIPVPDASLDVVLLMAVLTCIPSNAGQQALLDQLYAKLRPGGLLYLSDYYLQPDRLASGAYFDWQGDPENAGVFTLPEGATLRHHTLPWIAQLTHGFTPVQETRVPVFTMNGNQSQAFQLLVRKPV